MRLTVSLPIPVKSDFDYAPGAFGAFIRAGYRVLVPFGKRKVAGYVTAVSEGDESGLKSVESLLDDEPILTAEQLVLARWMAGYYQASVGEVLQAFYPPDSSIRPTVKIRLLQPPDHELGWGDVVLSRFREKPEWNRSDLLKSLAGIPGAATHLSTLIRQKVLSEESRLQTRGTRVKTDFLKVKEPERLAGLSLRQGNLRRLRDYLIERQTDFPEGFALKSLLKSFGLLRSRLDSWLQDGLVYLESRLVSAEEEPTEPLSPTYTLTQEQHTAVQAIRESVKSGEYKTFLLFGITGSGKTLVYIEALREALRQGKTGLILVPEIALTPQTVRRFEVVFGTRIGVLHSRRSPAERYRELRMILAGQHRIVIGPRSALFAPLPNLGIIIVDEEHDGSYKQNEPAPRYQARDTAVYRGFLNTCTVVLGSATPSFESYQHAQEGKYHLLLLKNRADTATLPTVQLPERKLTDRGPVWETMKEAVGTRLAAGQSVIMLQNRRGYSHFLECHDCGWVPGCPHCSITLVWHRQGHHLRCHYCGYSSAIPSVCERCQSVDLKPVGAGTQQVEDVLSASFPGTTVIRMDQDTTSSKKAHTALLDQFRASAPAILLGTQMIAKGLDFHEVTLVGVLDADRGLHAPDFRATERTFQLLTQVAGRSGRGRIPGDVLIQTRDRDQPLFGDVIRHDFDAFFRSEIETRKELGYPPFRRLILFEVKARDAGLALTLATQLRETLSRSFPATDLRGPAEPVVGRISDWYRQQILLFLPRQVSVNKQVAPVIRSILETARSDWPSASRLIVDVDPA